MTTKMKPRQIVDFQNTRKFFGLSVKPWLFIHLLLKSEVSDMTGLQFQIKTNKYKFYIFAKPAHSIVLRSWATERMYDINPHWQR
jgi:hypothetical protein